MLESRLTVVEEASAASGPLPEPSFLGLLVRGGLGSFGVQAGALGLAALVQVVLARTLGPDAFGDYLYALTCVNFLSLVGVLGFDTLSLRLIPSYHVGRDFPLLRGFLTRSLAIGATISIALGAAFALVVAATRSRFGAGFWAAGMLAAVLLPLLSVSKLLVAWLQSLHRAVAAQVPPLLGRPALFLVLLLVALFGVGAPRTAGLVMGLNLLSTGAALLASALLVRRELPADVVRAPRRVVPGSWAGVALRHSVIGLSQVLLLQADTLMMGSIVSTRQAGVYGVASKLAILVGFGVGAVNAVAAPLIAELHAAGDRRGLERLVRIATLGMVAYAAVAGGGLAVMRGWILGLFGPAFLAGQAPMLTLIVSQLVVAAYGTVGFLLTMTGHEVPASQAIVGSAALDVGLNAVLIPRFGLEGAAVATLLAVVARNVWLSFLVRRHLGLRPFRILLGLPGGSGGA